MDARTLLDGGTASGSFTAAKAHVRGAVETFLRQAFDAEEDCEVTRAGRYAALGGGHRWRALIAVAAGNIFRENALRFVLPAAAGVELAHAASLVLDDLPSMDNARIRRGKPCTHLAFPDWAADMAPVFLVTLAYRVSLDNPLVAAKARVEAALELSNAGLMMIRGQVLDLRHGVNGCPSEEERLFRCYRLKSAALYGAAAKMGGILTGASCEDAASLHAAGVDLGFSYQLLDDVADVEAGVAEVGKECGMDEDKLTAIDLFGVEGARRRSREFQERGLSRLERFGKEADWLRSLIAEASWKAN